MAYLRGLLAPIERKNGWQVRLRELSNVSMTAPAPHQRRERVNVDHRFRQLRAPGTRYDDPAVSLELSATKIIASQHDLSTLHPTSLNQRDTHSGLSDTP